MSRIGNFTRRTFMATSLAVAGGVAFGVYKYRTPGANPLLDDLPEGSAAPNPYVRIDADGVTLITPRADKGQGAYAIQAALIAEELDYPLEDVRIDPGSPSPAYWNTALAGEAAKFVAPEGEPLNWAVHGVLDAVMKFSGMMITGGSSTVPDGYQKLRLAGAVARETMKQAASFLTGYSRFDMTTENGVVTLPNGQTFTYQELAKQASQIAPVSDVTLRDPSTWRYLGKEMLRLDIVPKSTGTLTYGIDRKVDGMVHATVLLNPAQGGALLSYDAEAALAMRGVKSVVPITGGLGVVADNTWRAFQAAEAINAEWGPAPFPADTEDHWAALDAAFGQEKHDSRARNDGNVDEALVGREVITAEYRVPYLAHAPLEPVSAIVRVDDNAVEIWTGTQIPRFVENNISRITGVPRKNITLHVEYMGGSFGHRLEDDYVRHAAEIAMTMKGTPVKLTYRREEDMAHDYPRQIAMARMRGAVSGGMVETLDLSIAAPSVISSQMGRQGQNIPGPDATIVEGAWNSAIQVPNFRVTGYRAEGLAPVSSWRSVGASSNGFFQNIALDELIHAAGADPLTERLRLCANPLARATLEAVAEMSNWSGPSLGDNRGRGIAMTESFGVHCAEVIDVTATDDGIRIDNVYVAAEVGRVLDPVNFENLMQGGVIFALGHAMNCEITYTDGAADQLNYYDYEGMRISQAPEIMVRGLENGNAVKGIGEPPVPPAAPALSSAIFAATGQRLREMPFSKFVDFV